MHLSSALRLLPLVFIVFLAAEQGGNVDSNDLGSRLQRWNDALPEDRTYVQCDKPFYSPGETIWFSVFVRDGRNFKASSKSDIVYAELVNPKGSVERQAALIVKQGIACGDFTISESVPGGMYSLKVYTNWQKNDPDPVFFTKELQVQAVVLPRLKMKLDFAKKAYGAGANVRANLTLETNENKPLAVHPIDYTVTIDGTPILTKSMKSDNAGKAAITFKLPENLKSSDGLLNVILDYEGQAESISRSIPIVLNKITLSFFPEGGDLVSGLTSRVAFKAVNEFGKGADIEGYISDGQGKKAAEFSSYHFGMGVFDLTPVGSTAYTAHITKPAGITTTYPLPSAMPQGYVLTIDNASRSSLKLSIGSTRNEQLRIFIQVRGKKYFSKQVSVKKGITNVAVDLTAFPVGVAQVTLFDAKQIERAERLVFVNRHKKTTLTLKTDKEKYQPREKVKMTITATDESGMRMPGHFALAVTDDQLLSFADDKSSTILSHMLAEADVKGKIEEPRFYFDPKEVKADTALDCLLLTSGWRRFTWKRIVEEEVPVAGYPGEKAVISGVVMDRSSGKGAAGVDVTITETGAKTRTDSAGVFLIKNVELYEPKTVVAKKNGLQASIVVNRYSSSLQLWLYPHAPRHERAARGGEEMELLRAEIAQAEVVDRKAVPAARKQEIMNKIAGLEKKKGALVQKKAEMMPAAGYKKPGAALKPAAVPEPAMEEKRREQPGLKKVQMAKAKAARQMVQPKIMKEEAAFDAVMVPPPPEPAVPGYYRAREFAVPDYQEKQQPQHRTDFRSTVFWKGDVELGNNGTATVEFYTSDAVTSFRAISEGFTTDGGIGRAEQVFYSQLPFSLSAKIPPVLITGDTIDLSLLISNKTNALVNGKLTVTIPPALSLLKKIVPDRSVPAGASVTVPVMCRVVSAVDSVQLGLSFYGKGFSDALLLPLRIIPQGFPVDLSFSGNELTKEYPIKIANCVPHSITASLTAYPSVVSDLLAGIESILREPYGCFEQTSVSSYPNALVLSYLKKTDNPNSDIMKRAEELLDKGYNRLVTFETRDKGYEWFGQQPGHEALTAYGLMQFNDMQKAGGKVDAAMVTRTTDWLMKRRDNKGGFLRNPQALDSYGGADPDITNAYIVYALAEAGRRDIQKELDASVAYAKKSGDPYVIGLVANALFCFGQIKTGEDLLKQVIGKQAVDGSWCGLTHSITRSGGISLKLETTALICMALMKSKQPDNQALTGGIKYLVGSRSGSGGFGATQSTILSLKALTAYAQFARKTDAPGTIVVTVDKKDVARKKYAAGERGAIVIDSLDAFLRTGDHTVAVRFEGTKNPLPYSFAVSYYTWKPASSDTCKVALETTIASPEKTTSVKVGQTLRVSTVLRNTKDEGLPMTIAILGLPAGLSPQPWQLKELQEKKIVDFYETEGSTVVFYYRQMKPGEIRTVNLDCKAEVPGYYTAPASRAYLYYTNEYKVWTSITPVRIVR